MNKRIKLSVVALLLTSSVAMAEEVVPETTEEVIDANMASSDIEGTYASEPTVSATKDLKQSLNFGATNTSGNSKTLNINGKYDMSFSTVGLLSEIMKVNLDASGFVTKNNEVRDNEEYAVNLGFEQFVGSGWLGYTTVSWFKNNFKNFDNKVALGVGIGKELFATDKQSLKFKLGVAYNIEQYYTPQAFDAEPVDDRKFGSLNEYLEYNYQFNSTSKFFAKIGASENFEDLTKDYDVLTSLGFNFSLAQNISLTLEEEITFDNLPAGAKKTDTKTIVRVGYSF